MTKFVTENDIVVQKKIGDILKTVYGLDYVKSDGDLYPHDGWLVLSGEKKCIVELRRKIKRKFFSEFNNIFLDKHKLDGLQLCMKEENLPVKIVIAYRDGVYEYDLDPSHKFKLGKETGRVDRNRHGFDVCAPYIIPISYWGRISDCGDIFEDIDG